MRNELNSFGTKRYGRLKIFFFDSFTLNHLLVVFTLSLSSRAKEIFFLFLHAKHIHTFALKFSFIIFINFNTIFLFRFVSFTEIILICTVFKTKISTHIWIQSEKQQKFPFFNSSFHSCCEVLSPWIPPVADKYWTLHNAHSKYTIV